MPAVAQFRGITVYIYAEPGGSHHLPHFHAYYGEYLASFSINPPELLEGFLPRPQLRFVLAWAELYRNEIEQNWYLVQARQLPKKIKGF